MSLGGGEVLNSARAVGYTTTADCPVSWLVCPPCPGIPDALGHNAYFYANISEAPWYDEEDEPTHRFLGAHGIEFEGIPDSTREATVAEGILDGGVVGKTRNATRRIRVRAMLTAIGEDALETGFSWLNSALTPGKCGTHGDACGAADARFYAACPPAQADVTMPETFWNDPLTNLATNPSMETAGAEVVVRTNLATNPSFEAATAATVEVRRNQHPNPRMDNLTTGWWPSFPTEMTAQAGGTLLTFPSAVTAQAPAFYSNDETPAVAGETWYAGIDVTVPAGQPAATLLVGVHAYVGGSSAANARSAPVTIQPGATARLVSPVLTMPEGTTKVALWLDIVAPGVSAGSTVVVKNGILEKSGSNTAPYFDGSTLPAGDFTHAWTGTPNASASVAYGVVPPGASGVQSAAIQSAEWASTGTKSIRVIALPGNNNTRAILHTSFVVVAGETYTIMAKIRLAAPLAGSLSPYSRTLLAYFSGSSTFLYSDPAPNTAGVHDLRYTVTVPDGDTTMQIRGYNGTTVGNGDVWFDDFLVVKGTYAGPYFDGSTPAKVRRNLATDPAHVAAWGLNSVDPGGSSTLDTAHTHGLPDAVKLVKGTGFTYSQIGMSAVGGLTPGDVVYTGVWVYADAPVKLIYARRGSAGYSATARNITAGWNWVQVSEPVTAVGQTVKWDLGWEANDAPTGTAVWMTQSLVEVNRQSDGSDWFGGTHGIPPLTAAWEGAANASPSYLTDPDFTYAWTGTAHASTSEQKALPVAQTATANSSVNTSAMVSSTHWASNRVRSLRIMPLGAGSDTGADVAGSAASLTGLGVTFEPGKTYTISAKVRQDAVHTGPFESSGRPRTIFVTDSVRTWAGAVKSAQAPNAIGETALSLTFTVSPGATWAIVRLYNGASAGNDIWWDDLLIVEGEYPGDYFDGSFPDSTPEDHQTVGKQVAEYEWTGEPDASTSAHRTGTVVAVEDPVTWDKMVDRMVRNLHTVTCVSGPTVVQKMHRGNTWGYLVEFVLVAAVPWMFGDTKPIVLQPSTPIVVQDVPFNLVPYPSAELESGTVIAAKNYSINPSVEVDATAWSTDGTITPRVVARSTELWSVGTASAKVTASPTAAGSAGWFAAEHTIDIPGLPAGTRMSFNEWASASVESGTAVLGTLEIIAVWFNGATYLTESVIGSGPASGGAKSYKSIPVPVGADRVMLRAKQNVTSWDAGAVLRLYADAAAVTVP